MVDASLNIVLFRKFQVFDRLNYPWLVLVLAENLEQFIEQFGIIANRVIHTCPVPPQYTFLFAIASVTRMGLIFVPRAFSRMSSCP
jgi:hypothetical protein